MTTKTTNRHGFIVEDGGNYIQVTLPDWLTPDQRRRFEEELDDIFPPGSRVKRRRPEAVSTAIVAFVHDEAARQGIKLSIPDPPTVDELAAAADALGMLPSDIARKAEDARMGG